MRKDFACIVISHGRPECSTVKVLRECGYTGKIYIVVDDEDKTLPDYIERYGADVHVFHKEENFDTGDLGGSMACGVFARNQCLKVAEKNNLTYYLELDDDLESLTYRYNDDGHLRGIKAKGIDRLFEGMCIYFDEAPVQCLGFGNAVDYIGGVPTFESGKANRTVMNSFFLRTSNKIYWRSRNSDDIITVVDEGQKGHAGFRFTPVMNKFDVWIPKRKSDARVPFTRIIEHKHFTGVKTPTTIITKEYPQKWEKGKDRYYPIEDEKNKALYQKYKELADRDGLITVGRLAEYKYYNMDSAIESALKVVREICEKQ